MGPWERSLLEGSWCKQGVCTCMCSHMLLCVYGVCVCMYMYVCAHVCMVYICVSAYVCVHVYMEYEGGAYACVHECVCMCANQRLMLCALLHLTRQGPL